MTESELLERASRKSALFAGERIHDRYLYVRPLGRPSKDAILSVEKLGLEEYVGGVDAAAVHAKAFCTKVEVRHGGTTYAKTRFVEKQHMRKMFEYYDVVRVESQPKCDDLQRFDVVAVLDYGHGMFDAQSIPHWLCGRWLAVNVQTNSGNYGYNLATKYPAVDYLCVDEAEARLATQNRDGPIQDSLMALSYRAMKTVITLGREGAIGYSEKSGLVRCPAFTDEVVDTIGAGDAFFAVTALISQEADMHTLLRVGNAAGAIKARIVGHTRGVTRDELTGLLASVRRPSEQSAAKYPG